MSNCVLKNALKYAAMQLEERKLQIKSVLVRDDWLILHEVVWIRLHKSESTEVYPSIQLLDIVTRVTY